jgi:hypothetical protein
MQTPENHKERPLATLEATEEQWMQAAATNQPEKRLQQRLMSQLLDLPKASRA